MKFRKNQIYQVEFKNGNITEVYNSLKSIYAHHTAHDVGCKVDWLWQNKITEINPFENAKVKISLIKIKK